MDFNYVQKASISPCIPETLGLAPLLGTESLHEEVLDWSLWQIKPAGSQWNWEWIWRLSPLNVGLTNFVKIGRPSALLHVEINAIFTKTQANLFPSLLPPSCLMPLFALAMGMNVPPLSEPTESAISIPFSPLQWTEGWTTSLNDFWMATGSTDTLLSTPSTKPARIHVTGSARPAAGSFFIGILPQAPKRKDKSLLIRPINLLRSW